jgi:phospholipase A1
MQKKFQFLLVSSTLMAPLLGNAAELEKEMLRCSVIGDASARLGCFDALSKTAEQVTIATGGTEAEKHPAAAAAAQPPVMNAPPVAAAKVVPEASISRTVQTWELDDASKRGLFAFRPYRDDYLLVTNYSTSSNKAPFIDQTPAGLDAKHVELTFQLSFKMKALEDIGGSPVDLWLGYTQNSFWQAYNRAASSPFRESNYQPELMAVAPLHFGVGGLDFRFVNLGLVHQSNGQSGTLSRSWNRVYAQVGADAGNFAVDMRLWKRLDTSVKDNDNVDITDYLGHGDLHASYRVNGQEFSLTARRNFATRHGSLEAGWAIPIKANLKGYLHLFSGYGESLIDYNYSQKSLGAGFLVDF